MEDAEYQMCAKPGCFHFVESNYSAESDPDGGWAEFDHLDDGEVEYDHDARPGVTKTLAEWRHSMPELFATYPDGKIGPNSSHFRSS